MIFVPVSPIEEHGPHLPLGTDMYTCRALAEALATQLEERYPDMTAVVLPVTPLGSGTVPYLGTIGSPPRLVRDVLMRIGQGLCQRWLSLHCGGQRAYGADPFAGNGDGGAQGEPAAMVSHDCAGGAASGAALPLHDAAGGAVRGIA